MPDQKYFIQREVFEVNTSLTDRVYELQNRVSQLSGNRLTVQMEDFFNRNMPPDIICRIDELVLDLGEVQYDKFEQEVEERFMEELEKVFSKKNAASLRYELPLIPELETTTLLTGRIQLLEYFLLNGTMPWWALPGNGNSPLELLSELAATEPAALYELLMRIGEHDQVIKRIVYHFPDVRIQQIIEIAEPSGSAFIIRYFTRVMEFKQETKLIKAEKEDFRNSVWEFILKFLFQHKESVFTEKMFLKSNLKRLAGHYNISFRELLIYFQHSAEMALQPTTQHLLVTLLEDIYEEENPLHETMVVDTAPGIINLQRSDDLMQKLESIDYYLLYDALPSSLWGYSTYSLRSVLFELLHAIPVSTRKLFTTGSRGSGYYQRLYQLTGPDHTKTLLLSLFPEFISPASELERTVVLIGQTTPYFQYSSAEARELFWVSVYSAFATNGMQVPDTNALIQEILGNSLRKENRSIYEHRLAFAAAINVALEAKGNDYPMLKEFAESLAEMDDSGMILFSRMNKRPEDLQPATLRNLLAFLLRFGSIPWWGKAVSVYSIPGMLEELYHKDPDGLQILFRQSMTDHRMRARIFEHLDPAIIEQLLHRFPSGDKAIVTVGYFIRVANQAGIFTFHDSLFISKTFIRIAAELLNRENYSFFPGTEFFMRAFIQSSGILEQPLSALVKKVLDSRKGSIVTNIDADRELQMLRAVYSILREVDNEDNSVPPQDFLNAVINDKKPLKGSPFVDDDTYSPILQQYFKLEGLSREQQVIEISAALEYFLVWNQLPARFLAPDQGELQVLMRLVLLFLFQADRERLKIVLEKTDACDSAYLFLDELVEVSGEGSERELKHFLLGVRNSRIDLAGMTEQGLFFTQETDLRYTAETGGDNSFALDALDPFGKGEEELKRRSREWFSYFLLNGRFPDESGAYDPGKADRFFEWIIIFLFKSDKDFLGGAIADPANNAANRLHAVDRFVFGYDILSSRITLFFDPYREVIIQACTVASDKQIEKDPVREIGERVTSSQGNQIDDPVSGIDPFRRSPSVAKKVLEKEGVMPFLLMVSEKLGTKRKEEGIVLQTQRIIQKIADADEDASRIHAWFNEYNLWIYSLAESFISDETYIRNLLRFIAERGGRKAMKIMENFLQKSGKEKPFNAEESKDNLSILKAALPGERMMYEERRKISELLRDKEKAEAFVSLQEKKDIYREKIMLEIKKELSVENGDVESKLSQPGNETPVLPKDNLYISNAGLILFHPFLVTFLERAGLLVERKFPEPKDANRAVLLLQYLASGSEQFQESDLVLNKIICGLSVPEPISLHFEPTEIEIRVIAELYEVLAERWPQIGKTSIEGIRNSFIMRNGMLSLTEDGWKLRVEQRAYDILLQTLPWAFGIIKTPMMEKALITEWI